MLNLYCLFFLYGDAKVFELNSLNNIIELRTQTLNKIKSLLAQMPVIYLKIFFSLLPFSVSYFVLFLCQLIKRHRFGFVVLKYRLNQAVEVGWAFNYF